MEFQSPLDITATLFGEEIKKGKTKANADLVAALSGGIGSNLHQENIEKIGNTNAKVKDDTTNKRKRKAPAENDDDESPSSEEDEDETSDVDDVAIESDDEAEEEEEIKEKTSKTEKKTRSDKSFKADDERNRRTIFIGNLPVSAGVKKLKKHLKKLFGEFGSIETIRFRSVGFSNPSLPPKANFILKNFHEERDSLNAYITFVNESSVVPSLSLNGSEFEGKHIRVDRADNKQFETKNTVFVGNLPWNAKEEELRSHFASCGKIENIRIIRDKKMSIGKGFAYVTFEDKSGADLATEFHGIEFGGRDLRVVHASKRPDMIKKRRARSMTPKMSPAERRILAKKKKRGEVSFEGMKAAKGKISIKLNTKNSGPKPPKKKSPNKKSKGKNFQKKGKSAKPKQSVSKKQKTG